ncbi:MAG: tetratricopeptide repeat protein [Saprospirales bacterium]|nr:MAG: tetratricopeptide repeat protein [Saprospirales bacterium]
MDRLEQLENLLKESPNDPFILYAIAKELENKGQLQTAMKKYDQLMEKHPDYVGTYYHYGGVLEKLNKRENAIQIYRAGLLVAQKLQDNHAYRELFQSLQEISEED